MYDNRKRLDTIKADIRRWRGLHEYLVIEKARAVVADMVKRVGGDVLDIPSRESLRYRITYDEKGCPTGWIVDWSPEPRVVTNRGEVFVLIARPDEILKKSRNPQELRCCWEKVAA